MRKSRTTRDAGLRQVSTATKWLAGAAAVLTGFITVWEAHNVKHASATTPTVAHQPASTGSSNTGSSGSSDGSSSGSSSGYSDPSVDPGYSDGGLQAPAAAPAPSDQQPAASSGGS